MKVIMTKEELNETFNLVDEITDLNIDRDEYFKDMLCQSVPGIAKAEMDPEGNYIIEYDPNYICKVTKIFRKYAKPISNICKTLWSMVSMMYTDLEELITDLMKANTDEPANAADKEEENGDGDSDISDVIDHDQF